MSRKAPAGSSCSGKLSQLWGEQAWAGQKAKAGEEVGCHPESGERVVRMGGEAGVSGTWGHRVMGRAAGFESWEDRHGLEGAETGYTDKETSGRRFCFLGGGGAQICSECKQQAPQLCPQGTWGHVLRGSRWDCRGPSTPRRGSFHEITIVSGTSLSPLPCARDKDPETRLKF